MVNITKTMLECERKLRERIETRRRFEGSYVDPNDLDPSTGQGRTKKFIPSNIRKATMPLNCSDTVQKDNRCASASSAITTTLGKATIIHEKWKQEMATLAKEIADSEITARKQFQFCDYCDAHVDLAEGFLEVAKTNEESEPTSLSDTECVHAAIKAVFEDYKPEHWKNLRFTASSDGAVLAKFYKAYEQHTGINYEAIIKPKVDALESYGDANDDIHPDFKFICFIQEQLDRAIPTLTTDLWAFDRKADAEKS